MVNKDGNSVKWELSAKKAVFPEGNNEILLISLEVQIPSTPGIYLNSASGIYKVDKGDITLSAPVEMYVGDTIFRTTEMKWNNSKEILTADNNVEFIGATFSITGKGLTANTKEHKVRILKDVKAIFYL